MKCAFCQNASISQVSKRDGGITTGIGLPPAEIVRLAEGGSCASISYTYTEPTIFFEYARDTARLARERGLKNVFVSNGYITLEAIRGIVPWLDAINIDLKSFSDATYRRIMGAPLQPVLEAIREYHRAGVWLEITTLVVPGLNDSRQELKQIADFIVGLGETIPWHVSRFHPDYKMTDILPTPRRQIDLAVRTGRSAGLRYVYAGNLPGDRDEQTACPECGELLIERRGFIVVRNALSGPACPRCGTGIPGVGLSHEPSERR